ncbi:MAG: hypothetical protein ACLFNU_12620, partial [Bacteroidales bacterium]
MKRVLLFLTAAALVASFTSCMEQCEIDDSGEVRVTNNTDVALWFDVTEANDDYENENRNVSSGSSTTYTMPEGRVNIWVAEENDNEMFEIYETLDVTQCETTSYSLEECVWYHEGTVEVTNNTGYDAEVLIWQAADDGSYYGDGYYISDAVEVADGESVLWEMMKADVEMKLYFKYIGESWVYETYTLDVCEDLEWEWTAKKMKSVKTGELPENM